VKLKPYVEAEKRGVLLLESDDIALMNEQLLLDVMREDFPAGLPSTLTEVWHVDTGVAQDPLFHDLTAAMKAV